MANHWQNSDCEELLRITSGLKDLWNEAQLTKEPVLILVVGFHGSGKSSLIDYLKQEFPDSFCMAASNLLSWEKKDKRVDDVTANQKILVDALKEIRKEHPFIILDGHLSLLNSEHEYEFVGMDVVKAIHPSMIILVSTEPDVVEKRLSNRDDRHILSLDSIRSGIIIEEKLAYKVATDLNIPIYILRS